MEHCLDPFLFPLIADNERTRWTTNPGWRRTWRPLDEIPVGLRSVQYEMQESSPKVHSNSKLIQFTYQLSTFPSSKIIA